MKDSTKKWLIAASRRALKTLAQTAAALIVLFGANAIVAGYPVLSDIPWDTVASASCLAAILSLLTSIGGIPEVDEGKSLPEIGKE